MLTIDALRAYGANTEEGLARCMNNEAFYVRLIGMALQDAHFEALEAALSAGDTKAAFEAAHALKGVLGNLALTPIYSPAAELTELLRANTPGDYAGYLARIKEARQTLTELAQG